MAAFTAADKGQVLAARLLSELGGPWSKATPSRRGEIAQGLVAEIDVLDDRIVGARLARSEYLPLIAPATLRARTSVARPEGIGRVRTARAPEIVEPAGDGPSRLAFAVQCPQRNRPLAHLLGRELRRSVGT